jgi:MATE family multidrug resistance protein
LLLTLKTSPIYQESKKLLQLAIPLASAQVAQSLIGFVDTLMMGRLGATTLAAGGLASITLMTLISIFGAVIMAVTPLIAEADGAQKKHRVAVITSQGFYLVVILTIPIAMIIANLDRLFLAMGQDPITIALADTYLDIMAWGCFPILGFMLLRGVTSGLSHARPLMLIVMGGTIFNIVGNYVLAFGKLGLPRLEIAGLAIASVITFWLMFLALIVYLMRHPRLRSYCLFTQSGQFQPVIFLKLIQLGTPIGIFIALESGLFAVVTYLMGALGTETLAAHQIVLQTIVIIFMIPLGISYATTIRVGQALGKEDLVGIQRAATLSIILGLVFNLAIAIAICLFPQLVIGLYLDLQDPANLAVIKLAVPMLTFGVVALILDGMQKIIYGALQGLQDTQIPVLLSIPAFWGIGLTLGYILSFNYGVGGMGLWIGQSLGLAIAAILFLIRLLQMFNRLKFKAIAK